MQIFPHTLVKIQKVPIGRSRQIGGIKQAYAQITHAKGDSQEEEKKS